MSVLDYGIIGNGKTAALVSDKGSIDWLCLPDFDSPSVFGKILDNEKGGYFAIVPIGGYTTEQSYLPNTNILETTFRTDQGAIFRIIDFMPRDKTHIEGSDYENYCLIRIIEPLEGEAEINVRFEPRHDYGRGETNLSFLPEGLFVAETADTKIYLNATMEKICLLGETPFHLKERVCFVLSNRVPTSLEMPLVDHAMEALKKTTDYWRSWVKNCRLPERYQETVIRSALALKLLVYEKTGAIIAASTTSLPEESGACRNWDYRYCWIRDALFIVSVLFELSLFEEKRRYIQYLERVSLGEHETISPLFTVQGERVPKEIYLEHWQGFEGSKPIRVGNNATDHYQDDVYGEIMLALHQFFTDKRFVKVESNGVWKLVKRLAEMAEKRFNEKDSGPWEFNNNKDHYTFSKVMCWVALDRAVDIAGIVGEEQIQAHWLKVAEEMKAEILEKAWNPDVGAFTQAYGSADLDATTLLLPIVGFISARDDRMLATIEMTEKKLGKNGYIFRYTHEDDFGVPQNAFLVCTFWLIDNWILSGQVEKAQARFEELIVQGNHLGLFSEHMVPESKRLIGNFPQGYTHVAIIYTAILLSSALSLKNGYGYFHEPNQHGKNRREFLQKASKVPYPAHRTGSSFPH